MSRLLKYILPYVTDSSKETYNFLVAGGAASYGALRIGETIVRIFLGDALELDLADESHRTASLVVFAQADLGRCLCSLGDLPLCVLISWARRARLAN